MARDKHWYDTLYTYIWLFNTGRGLSVCIRLPHNLGIIYDLGSNNDFSPVKFMLENIIPRLKNSSIAQCILSHPHADHISEIDFIIDRELNPSLLTCPNDKENQDEDQKVDFERIIRDDNQDIINKYREAYKERNLPLQTIQKSSFGTAPNLEYGIYYLRPGYVALIHDNDSQKYCNGLSIVLYLRHRNQSILIPGDITPEVFKEVINGGSGVERRYTYFRNEPPGTPSDFHKQTSSQPILRDLLQERGLSVLIAPHHGLESGFCKELFEVIKDNKPQINVISEKRHLSDSDGEVSQNYQSPNYSKGINVNIEGENESRYSVSTRNGHHILMIFEGTNSHPRIYLRKDPKELLNITKK